jgi:hypothetical protein
MAASKNWTDAGRTRKLCAANDPFGARPTTMARVQTDKGPRFLISKIEGAVAITAEDIDALVALRDEPQP